MELISCLAEPPEFIRGEHQDILTLVDCALRNYDAYLSALYMKKIFKPLERVLERLYKDDLILEQMEKDRLSQFEESERVIKRKKDQELER